VSELSKKSLGRLVNDVCAGLEIISDISDSLPEEAELAAKVRDTLVAAYEVERRSNPLVVQRAVREA